MALSKKDYVALAEILLASHDEYPEDEFEAGINSGVWAVERRLIKYLTLDNPRFDVVSFREASNFSVPRKVSKQFEGMSGEELAQWYHHDVG